MFQLMHRVCAYTSAFCSLITARCYTQRGYATVCRLPVCLSVHLSVTFKYRNHIG